MLLLSVTRFSPRSKTRPEFFPGNTFSAPIFRSFSRFMNELSSEVSYPSRPSFLHAEHFVQQDFHEFFVVLETFHSAAFFTPSRHSRNSRLTSLGDENVFE